MARIRSIKPEFWDSPSTAQASLRARLFYIAMWNWADDWGVGDANPRRLLGFAFPNDESSDIEPRNFRRLASEVAESFGVVWYEVEGRSYYAIPSWEDHQRTEKKARRAFPAPDQAERILYSEVSEVPTPSSGSSDEGAGEQGSRGRGKGEEGELLPSPAAPSRTSDPHGFADFWQHYPRKVGRDDARKAYVKALKRASSSRILLGAHRYANDPNLPEKSFIPHPSKWLNDGRWDDEPLPARLGNGRPLDRQAELLRSEMERAQAADAAQLHRRQIGA